MIVSGRVLYHLHMVGRYRNTEVRQSKSIKIKLSIVLRAHHKALSRAKHLANRIEGYESNKRLYYKSLS